jgi:hypothetical protein
VKERRSPIPLRRELSLLVPLFVGWTAAVMLIFVIAALDPDARDNVLLHPALNGFPWYTGLLSNLAVVGWIVASTAGFLGGFVAWVGNRKAAARMQIMGAVVTLAAAFDQLFQFHRIILGTDSFGGRALVLVSYIVLGSVWVIVNQKELARTRVIILGAAMSSLLMSATVDLLGNEIVTSRALFVDGTTFLSAMAWAIWFVTTTTDISRSVVRSGVLPDPTDADDSAEDAVDTASDTTLETAG